MNGNVCVDPRCPLGSPNRRLCSDADFAQKLCSWLVPMKIARIKRVPAGSPRRARLTEDLFVDMGTHGAWLPDATAGVRVLLEGEAGLLR